MNGPGVFVLDCRYGWASEAVSFHCGAVRLCGSMEWHRDLSGLCVLALIETRSFYEHVSKGS